MKRCLCLLMTLALLLCALCSCSGNIEVDPTSSNDPDPQSKETDISYESENPNSSDLSDDTSSGETSDISEESTTSDEPGIDVVIYDDLERYYSDSLNDIYLLSKIRTWDEIYAWGDNVYLKQPLSEISQLPPIYQAIKGLNVNRDEFTRVNAEWIAFNEEHGTEQSTYTDEQIEYMFGDYDENEIKQKLKQVTTYYYEGRLYTVYELMEADADLFNEMIESGGLEEFAVSIEKYVREYDLGDVRRLQKRIRDEGANSEDESNLRKGDVERHYPDELCDIWIISKLRTKDVIDEWVESVYLKQTEDEMDQLPAIYQAIKGLDIGRDEFTRVNAEWIAFNEEHGTGQSTYTDEQIEYMFGDYDENEIKQKLKQVTTYYYEGRLYTAYELVCVDDALFNEMIEKGGLEDYSVLVEKYADGDTHYVHVLQKRIRGEDITDE